MPENGNSKNGNSKNGNSKNVSATNVSATNVSATNAGGKSAGKKSRSIAIGAGVAVAAVLLGLASYTATKPDDPSGATVTEEAAGAEPSTGAEGRTGVYPELEKLARRDGKDPLALGDEDAPVVMVEYADFKCGFCGKFARDTEPGLVEKYVEKGTLRIEWRNFPIFGADSERAARGAWAAGRQGRFWEFHEAAYAEGSKEKGFGDGRLKELAEEAGIKDVGRFVKDADSDGARAAVKKDQEEAYGLGATSTPSFLVNGRPISGAQPDRVFDQAIEAAAKTAEGAGKAGGKGAGGPR
ncbi:DsbA family protein [Streptomyces sp. NPDC050703]|uniref:DsbA family protein n=1 Tax=Streptomyces sp. NPDC050703 TaxID=3157218 RepID=UPI003444391E